MRASSSGSGRSRPVADAPELDGAEVAKAWLVELVARAPLDRAARLPGPRFPDDAPRLCAAVGAALASDAALADLGPGGTLAPLAAGAGQLADAGSPPEAIAALDALRAVVWDDVLEGLHRPAPAQVAELADRLSAVIAALTAAVLGAPQPLGPPGRRGPRSGPLAEVLRESRPAEDGEEGGDPGDGEDVGGRHGDAPAVDDSERAEPPRPERHAPRHATPPSEVPPIQPHRRRPSDAPAVPVVDRGGPHDDVSPPRPLRAPGRAVRAGASDGPFDAGGPDVAVLREDGEAAPAPSAAATLARIEATLREAATASDPLAEAAARLRSLATTGDLDLDLGEETAGGTAGPRFEDASGLRIARMLPWTAAIERRVARHREDGRPFAVMCLELADVDRLVAADRDRDVLAALEAAEAVILAHLRPADGLVRERAGRYWLTTPDTDAAEGRALAGRIGAAIAELPPHRGAPLEIAIGVATCPSDADEAPDLEALAEEGLFAARAAGVRVAGPPD